MKYRLKLIFYKCDVIVTSRHFYSILKYKTMLMLLYGTVYTLLRGYIAFMLICFLMTEKYKVFMALISVVFCYYSLC